MHRNFFKFITLSLFTSLNLLIQVQSSIAESTDKAIKIGAILVLTDDWGSWGINCQRGLLLAEKEINSSSEKKFKVIIENSPQAKPLNALTAYRKLKDIDKVTAIIGPMSPEEFSAVSPIAEREEVPIVSFVSSVRKTRGSFFVWIDPEIESKIIAEYVFKREKKIAILSSKQDWESKVGVYFENEVKRLGGIVVSREELNVDTTDVRSTVLTLKRKNPDALFIPSYLLFPLYVKELWKLQINLPVYSIELDQTSINNAGPRAEGVIFVKPYANSDAWMKTFTEHYGEQPDVPAAQCYDGLKILSNTIIKNNSNFQKIAEEFNNFTGYDGASGKITVVDGKTSMSTGFFKVVNGKMAELRSEEGP